MWKQGLTNYGPLQKPKLARGFGPALFFYRECGSRGTAGIGGWC
jgi:hypothetical protein